ncbi:MAG: hypothetical protein O3C05_01915 [Proteobacteria bacterium]|nr:hypothetical protein [Pseudomonadota bacterium]
MFSYICDFLKSCFCCFSKKKEGSSISTAGSNNTLSSALSYNSNNNSKDCVTSEPELFQNPSVILKFTDIDNLIALRTMHPKPPPTSSPTPPIRSYPEDFTPRHSGSSFDSFILLPSGNIIRSNYEGTPHGVIISPAEPYYTHGNISFSQNHCTLYNLDE